MEMSKWKRRRLAKAVGNAVAWCFAQEEGPLVPHACDVEWYLMCVYAAGYKHAIPAAEAYCQLSGRKWWYGPHEETIALGDK